MRGKNLGKRFRAVCPRCCANSVYTDCIDIDSMRKMAVELVAGKDGKQGGCQREMDFPPIFPPCPGASDREPFGVSQSSEPVG
jgi:hypothetical protein